MSTTYAGRRDQTGQLIETPRYPRPVPAIVEADAGRVPRRLGFPIQSRSIVRQRRAVPEEIVRDIGPGAGIRKPVDAISVQCELEAIGMTMTPAVRTAFETHIAAVVAQHRQALALEQDALRTP